MLQSVISVDPSLRSTGITLLTFDPENNVFDISLSTIKSTKGDERILVFRDLFAKTFGMCKEHDVSLGIVEGYSFMSQGNAFSQTIEAGAACRIGIAARGVPIIEIPPTLWKREVLKNGNASKKEIKEKVGRLTDPDRKPKNVFSRLFIANLPDGHWKSPDELDSLLMLVAFFNLLVNQEDYFHAHVRSKETLHDLRENIIETLRVNGLLRRKR